MSGIPLAGTDLSREILGEVLDERGKLMSSPDFAKLLGTWRDQGRAEVAFVIGGADGIDPTIRARAESVPSTWLKTPRE